MRWLTPAAKEPTIYHDIESLFWVALYLVLDTFGEPDVYGDGNALQMKERLLKPAGKTDLRELIDKAHQFKVSVPGRRNMLVALDLGREVLSNATQMKLSLQTSKQLPLAHVWELMAGMHHMIRTMMDALSKSGGKLDEMLVNRHDQDAHKNILAGVSNQVSSEQPKRSRDALGKKPGGQKRQRSSFQV